MIRRGKAEGWLHLPLDAFRSWAALNDVTFDRTVPGIFTGKGGALLAKEALDSEQDNSNVLLTVPRDLILSLERVQEHAKADKDFREVLQALDDFGRTPRGAILTFLLAQASISCPELSDRVGVHSPLSDYIKFLPMELLPTFWTPSELELLIGTTLAPAVSSKLKSLRREYDLLRASATNTRWYQIVQDHLDYDDWLLVDSMYRSRALDFPEIGHCMAPCIDLANHAACHGTVALYEKDQDGDGVLLLREGKKVDEGEEVSITYGDEKGACEMLFSYGFLDNEAESAATLFLSLNIPENDKFRAAKMEVAGSAPGFKLIDVSESRIDWTGDFIWLLIVNEDDGLRFELARTVDGEVDMQAFFQDQELTDGAAELYAILRQSDLWDVYHLRCVTLLQQRVFDQLQVLYSTQRDMDGILHGDGTDIREGPYSFAMTLRRLEFELMERAYEVFEEQKIELVQSSVVIQYLAKMNEEPHSEPDRQEEDFS